MSLKDIIPLCLAAYMDYGSTRYALDAPGTREANPLWQTRASQFAVKTGVCGGSSVVVWKLKKQKKYKTAKIVKYAFIGIQVGASFWNFKLGYDQRRTRK